MIVDQQAAPPASVCMSLLVPAFSTRAANISDPQQKKARALTTKKIERTVEQQLGLDNKSQYDLFALVPLKGNDHHVFDLLQQHKNAEVAVRITNEGNSTTSLSLRSIEDMLVCKEKSQHMLQKNNEALLQYVEEFKNLRQLILNEIGSSNPNSDTGSGGAHGSSTGPNGSTSGGGMVSAVSGVQGSSGVAQQSIVGQQMGNNRENILRKALKCKQLEDDNKKLRKLLKTQIENSEQLRQDTQTTIETLREEFDILVKELLQYKQKDDKAKPGTVASGQKNQAKFTQKGGGKNVTAHSTFQPNNK